MQRQLNVLLTDDKSDCFFFNKVGEENSNPTHFTTVEVGQTLKK